VSIVVPVCTACGHAVFPPRVLCPHCSGREWEARETDGVVEQLTERDRTRIASVRTQLGPVVIARVEADGTVTVPQAAKVDETVTDSE